MRAARRWYIAILLVSSGLVASGLKAPQFMRDGEDVSRLWLISAFVVAGGACLTPAWKAIRYMVTFLHELGHVCAAVFFGGSAHTIELRADSSGRATYSLPTRWGTIRRICVAGAGYVAPNIASVLSSRSVQLSISTIWLWVCCAGAAVACVVLVRTFWGVVVSGGIAGATYLGVALEYPSVAPLFVAALAGFTAVGGMRGALSQLYLDDMTDSDAEQIHVNLHVPARTVAGFQLLVCCFLAALSTVIIMS